MVILAHLIAAATVVAQPIGALPVESPASEAIGSVSRTLEAGRGKNSQERIPVKASHAVTVVLQGSSRCVSFDLREPGGQSLLPPRRDPHWIGESTWTETFWVNNWAGGDMVAELQAGHFASARLTVTLYYDDGFRVIPLVAPEVWKVGERFNLNACLARMGAVVIAESTEVTATITTPGGERIETRLYDDGQHGEGAAADGVFGRFVRTIETGRHAVSFQATARFGSDAVEREVEAVYYAIAKKERARFGGKPTFHPLDYDDDKLFNALSIDFPLHYPKGLRVAIHARLEDATGNVIHPGVTVMAQNMVARENHIIAIVVESERIVDHAVDGPFVLKDIRLWDKKADRLLDVLPEVTSEPFVVSAFQARKASGSQK